MSDPTTRADDSVLIEVHLHTKYSMDSRSELEEIEDRALTCGRDWLAVTDHDTIAGATRLRDRGRIPIVVGEEVSTSLGDVIGLFLKEEIEPGYSPEETMMAIKEQGGLVYIPHPFDRQRRTRLFKEALDNLIGFIDIIEVWNGKTRYVEDNDKAAAYAADHGVVACAGSDAHRVLELGRSAMEVNSFETASEFLDALRCGRQVLEQMTPLKTFRKRMNGMFGRGDSKPGTG